MVFCCFSAPKEAPELNRKDQQKRVCEERPQPVKPAVAVAAAQRGTVPAEDVTAGGSSPAPVAAETKRTEAQACAEPEDLRPSPVPSSSQRAIQPSSSQQEVTQQYATEANARDGGDAFLRRSTGNPVSLALSSQACQAISPSIQLKTELQDLTYVGQGATGVVYRGLVLPSTLDGLDAAQPGAGPVQVAVKLMICNTPQQLWQRAKEGLISKILQHPNLTRTYAMDVTLVTPNTYREWGQAMPAPRVSMDVVGPSVCTADYGSRLSATSRSTLGTTSTALPRMNGGATDPLQQPAYGSGLSGVSKMTDSTFPGSSIAAGDSLPAPYGQTDAAARAQRPSKGPVLVFGGSRPPSCQLYAQGGSQSEAGHMQGLLAGSAQQQQGSGRGARPLHQMVAPLLAPDQSSGRALAAMLTSDQTTPGCGASVSSNGAGCTSPHEPRGESTSNLQLRISTELHPRAALHQQPRDRASPTGPGQGYGWPGPAGGQPVPASAASPRASQPLEPQLAAPQPVPAVRPEAELPANTACTWGSGQQGVTDSSGNSGSSAGGDDSNPAQPPLPQAPTLAQLQERGQPQQLSFPSSPTAVALPRLPGPGGHALSPQATAQELAPTPLAVSAANTQVVSAGVSAGTSAGTAGTGSSNARPAKASARLRAVEAAAAFPNLVIPGGPVMDVDVGAALGAGQRAVAPHDFTFASASNASPYGTNNTLQLDSAAHALLGPATQYSGSTRNGPSTHASAVGLPYGVHSLANGSQPNVHLSSGRALAGGACGSAHASAYTSAGYGGACGPDTDTGTGTGTLHAYTSTGGGGGGGRQRPETVPFSDVLYHLDALPGRFLAKVLMEYCDGGTLLQRINGGEYMASPERGVRAVLHAMRALLVCLEEVAAGMAHLHSLNIIHGDLKPGNVLLASEPSSALGYVCKVSDFGLATALEASEQTITHENWGTVVYMAPESCAGRCRKASDVYSFGVLLWQMCTGQRPYAGLQAGQVLLGVKTGSLRLQWPPWVNKSLVKVGQACMRFEPKERPGFKGIRSALAKISCRLDQKLAALEAAVSSSGATALMLGTDPLAGASGVSGRLSGGGPAGAYGGAVDVGEGEEGEEEEGEAGGGGGAGGGAEGCMAVLVVGAGGGGDTGAV